MTNEKVLNYLYQINNGNESGDNLSYSKWNEIVEKVKEEIRKSSNKKINKNINLLIKSIFKRIEEDDYFVEKNGIGYHDYKGYKFIYNNVSAFLFEKNIEIKKSEKNIFNSVLARKIIEIKENKNNDYCYVDFNENINNIISEKKISKSKNKTLIYCFESDNNKKILIDIELLIPLLKGTNNIKFKMIDYRSPLYFESDECFGLICGINYKLDNIREGLNEI